MEFARTLLGEDLQSVLSDVMGEETKPNQEEGDVPHKGARGSFYGFSTQEFCKPTSGSHWGSETVLVRILGWACLH